MQSAKTDSKSLFKSKNFWVGAGFLALGLHYKNNLLIAAGISQIALRTVTKLPVHFKRKK